MHSNPRCLFGIATFWIILALSLCKNALGQKPGLSYTHENMSGNGQDIVKRDVQSHPHSMYVSEVPSADDMLHFFQESLVAYGEDVLQQCLDEFDIRKIISVETQKLQKQIRKLFLLTVILLSLETAAILGIIVYICQKGINESKSKFLGRRTLTNETCSSNITQNNAANHDVGATNPSYETDTARQITSETINNTVLYNANV